MRGSLNQNVEESQRALFVVSELPCQDQAYNYSAPKSQRFLRFAIAMPIADPRNRSISETRESNAALRFNSAMESR